MSDTTRDLDLTTVLWEVTVALRDAEVLAEEYAGYDEDAARRRIARRVVADRNRAAAARARAAAKRSGRGRRRTAEPCPAVADALVLDAACHVRAARALDALTWHVVDSEEFTEVALDADAWPHSQASALLFGSLLHLSGKLEGAQFWFQYAAGAGSRTAARCLYLLHLSRAEVSTARHWRDQAATLEADPGLPDPPAVPDRLEEALGASVIWSSPPITTQDLTFLPRQPAPAPSQQIRDRHRLPGPLYRAVAALAAEEDPDLGEIVLPGPQLAVALARCARLDPRRLTRDASAWSAAPLRAPRLTQGAERTAEHRCAPTALTTVHRALRVLEVINRYSGGVSLVQIARQTQLPPLMLAQVLRRLVRTNLATPIGPDAYVAGTALRLAGAAGENGVGRLQETLAWVRDAVGAAVYVSRYTDGEIAITQYADGPAAPVVEEWVDFRAAAHASAVGKALLTQLDYDSRMDHLARHKIARLTAHTITSEQVLFHQLDARGPGEALLDLQEYALGTVCAAVPITTGPDAECLALSLPGTDPRRLQQAARTLQSEAATVLLALLVTGGAGPEPAPTAAGSVVTAGDSALWSCAALECGA